MVTHRPVDHRRRQGYRQRMKEFEKIDPVELTAELIRRPSITPEDAGAMEVVERELARAGFECFRADRNGIANLVARWGEKGSQRSFGFNGHVDVVPPGNPSEWRINPFEGAIEGGQIWGRGAADMKSGVAAFVAAAVDLVRDQPPDGSIIVTITGDEEGDATDGTTAILDWMKANDEHMSVCLVGEPTCAESMGDTIKIGRRGSMTLRFKAIGKQGHSAYPHRARNPVMAMSTLMHNLGRKVLDTGTEHFDPSTLAITTIDTGNPATNVIPAICEATVNIRFNDAQSSSGLSDWVATEVKAVEDETGISFDVQTRVSGESFLTPPGSFTELVVSAVEAETGMRPTLSTTGGTSDARFIRAHCPVLEFGLVGKTMHQVDERVETAHILQLKAAYLRILRDYFA